MFILSIPTMREKQRICCFKQYLGESSGAKLQVIHLWKLKAKNVPLLMRNPLESWFHALSSSHPFIFSSFRIDAKEII